MGSYGSFNPEDLKQANGAVRVRMAVLGIKSEKKKKATDASAEATEGSAQGSPAAASTA